MSKTKTITNARPNCFKVDISSRTLIALFRPGSVHSGIASYDDCGWVFPDIYALIHCIYALVYSLNHLCLWLYVEGRIKELLYPFVCGIILYHPAPPFNSCLTSGLSLFEVLVTTSRSAFVFFPRSVTRSLFARAVCTCRWFQTRHEHQGNGRSMCSFHL